MKIIHIIESSKGGISTYLKNLIYYQQNSNKYKGIYLITPKNKITNSLKNITKNIYYYKNSRNIFKFIGISKKIGQIIDEINPDIIHLHSTFPGLYVRTFNFFKTNPKIIYSSHGRAFTQEINILKKIIYIIIEKILAKKTDIIINISKNEENKAKKYNILAKENYMIYNGIKDKNISNTKINFKINQSKINIGFIGRLDKQKGIDKLSKYFVKKSFPNINLYVIGDFCRQKKKKINQSKINYLGWIENEQIDNYYQLFDVIIIPSRWEGFGLTAIEAMRNSKAIIVSNRGALPEFIINNSNGYIFNFNQFKSLNKILNNLSKSKLKKMGKNGRKIYKKYFTFQTMNNLLEKNVYKI